MLHNRWADPAVPFGLYLLVMEPYWRELVKKGVPLEEISVFGVTAYSKINCERFPDGNSIRKQLQWALRQAYPDENLQYTPHAYRHSYYSRA